MNSVGIAALGRLDLHQNYMTTAQNDELFQWLAGTNQQRNVDWRHVPLLLAYAVSFAGFGFVETIQDKPSWAFVVAVLLWSVLLWRLGRVSRPLPGYVISRDGRQPIVYLREFATDYGVTAAPLASPFLHLLNRIGPVIALSSQELPRDQRLLRFVVTHDLWQAAIRDLVSIARLVVFGYGSSVSYEWEIEQVSAGHACERIVICLPDTELPQGSRELLYVRQRLSLERFVRAWIPEKVGNATYLMFVANRQTLVLHASGVVSLHRMDGSVVFSSDIFGDLLYRPSKLQWRYGPDLFRLRSAIMTMAPISEDRSQERVFRRALTLGRWAYAREVCIASLRPLGTAGAVLTLVGGFWFLFGR